MEPLEENQTTAEYRCDRVRAVSAGSALERLHAMTIHTMGIGNDLPGSAIDPPA